MELRYNKNLNIIIESMDESFKEILDDRMDKINGILDIYNGDSSAYIYRKELYYDTYLICFKEHSEELSVYLEKLFDEKEYTKWMSVRISLECILSGIEREEITSFADTLCQLYYDKLQDKLFAMDDRDFGMILKKFRQGSDVIDKNIDATETLLNKTENPSFFKKLFKRKQLMEDRDELYEKLNDLTNISKTINHVIALMELAESDIVDLIIHFAKHYYYAESM